MGRGFGVTQEFAVAQFVRDGFVKTGLFAEDGPIVAVNANAANPHCEPAAEITSANHGGDRVLLGIWAELDLHVSRPEKFSRGPNPCSASTISSIMAALPDVRE
jgi:Xaa-Pro aminopeptidase